MLYSAATGAIWLVCMMALNADNPTLEAARAAFIEERWHDAVVLADRALLEIEAGARVERELRILRGAALVRLRRFEEALVSLDAARDLGADGAEFRLERALALRGLGRQDEAQDEYQEAEKLLQDDPDKLEELRRRWRDSAKGEDRFQLRVHPTFGFDTNAIVIEEDTVLQDDFDREAFYFGALLHARYRIVEVEKTSLDADYRNSLRAYAGETDLSYTDNTLALLFRTPVGGADWLDLEIRTALGEMWLRGDGHFRTQRTAGLGFAIRPSEDWEIRLAGDVTDADYYIPDVPVEQDRDGVMVRGNLEVLVHLGDGWKVGPHFGLWDYDADGGDWEHRAWEIGILVATPEISGFEFKLMLGYVRAEFDEPHSLTDFTEERDDKRVVVRLSVKLRFLEKTLGFAPEVSVAYENWSSNVDAFDFDRWDVGGTADILALSF